MSENGKNNAGVGGSYGMYTGGRDQIVEFVENVICCSINYNGKLRRKRFSGWGNLH